jgi:plasmid stability protein
MHDSPWSAEEEQWIIWNGALGIRDFVTIGRVEVGPGGRNGWLEEPYDMVGPFSLDELETNGRIGFAACTVMSRRRWREDQAELRQEAFERHREAQERLYEELARSNARKRRRATRTQQSNEQEHRELLCLPIDGELEPSQIKAAYRRLAKKAHPDVGGSHEHFVRITEARNALLERIS